jgi:hypothetical protein
MLLEMFANELSLERCAPSLPAARRGAEQFVMTIREAALRGVQRALHAPADFFAIPLAEAYYWQNWFRDNGVDIELRRYFRSGSTKIPFLEDDPEASTAWAGIDCLWKERYALGLKAAYVADGLAISMASGEEWDSESIVVEIQEVVNDDVSCREEDVHHASKPRHVHSQVDWIEQRLKASVTCGRELWAGAVGFFPSLIFCRDVEGQMDRLAAEALPCIVRGLFRLNDYCVSWDCGAFDPRGVRCSVSPESAQTLQAFGAERTFLCPDDQRRVFSWHAKIGRWRIYFDPVGGSGNCVIGYVGVHLRTVQFR